MKTRLNLATAPLVSNRHFTVGAALLGILALAALFWLSRNVYTVWSSDRIARAQQYEFENRIASLRQQRQALIAFFEQPETLQRRQRAEYLNGLIQSRAFPWVKIFMDLERILPPGVRVISIAPTLEGDTVQLKIVVGASSDEGKLKFLRALESALEFSRIQLLVETRPERPDQSDRVLMELQAVYSAI